MNQAITVSPGEPYGMRKQLEAAQATIPLPAAGAPPATGPQPPAPQGGAPVPQLAGAQDFARPTERPAEPVTNGLPVGPGQGPEALTSAAPDVIGSQLRALYQTAPNNDLLRLIELHDRGF